MNIDEINNLRKWAERVATTGKDEAPFALSVLRLLKRVEELEGKLRERDEYWSKWWPDDDEVEYTLEDGESFEV